MTPDQFNLVSCGQLLLDDLSLCYYDIMDKSDVYVVPIRALTSITVKPLELVAGLRGYVREYAVSRGSRQVSIAAVIFEMIYNPILQSFARIDQDAKQAIDDALLVVDFRQTPTISNHFSVGASITDLILNRLEASRSGMTFIPKGCLQSSQSNVADLPSSIDYVPSITEEPLPVLWTQKQNSVSPDRRRLRISETFAKQIRVLKRMGFADEAAIQVALRESAGNVPRAAKFLMRTGNHHP
jgi:hypothetical protein